jgi:hypothetical protein
VIVEETPITPVDTNTVDLSVSGQYNHTLKADVKVSNASGNSLTINSDGLYCSLDVSDCEALRDCIDVEDTNTVDLIYLAGALSANVKVSPNSCNSLQTLNNGLYINANNRFGAQEALAVYQGSPIQVGTTPIILLTTGTVSAIPAQCRSTSVGFVVTGRLRIQKNVGLDFVIDIQIQKNTNGWGPQSTFRIGNNMLWDADYVFTDVGTVLGPGQVPDTYQIRMLVYSNGSFVTVTGGELNLLLFYGSV